jgi:quercetin dioxygenase-like cupin family protein
LVVRRFSVVLSVVVVLLLGIVAVRVQPGAVAQEATPSADMEPEGGTYEPVSFALGVDAPNPADFFLVRIGLEPGTGFPIEESDPSSGILLVESGAFTLQVADLVSVTRGAGLGEAMESAQSAGDLSAAAEAVEAGEAVTLEAGDAAYVRGNVTGEVRNDGQERAVGLLILLGPSEGMTAEATPAP